MTQVVLLVLALTAVCSGILPETVDSGISHILEDRDLQTGQTEQDGVLVEVQQLPEDSQPDDGLHQVGIVQIKLFSDSQLKSFGYSKSIVIIIEGLWIKQWGF